MCQINNMKDRIYEWMVENLPFRIMYRKVPFDGSYIWKPRRGWTSKQLVKSEKFAEDMMRKIKWD